MRARVQRRALTVIIERPVHVYTCLKSLQTDGVHACTPAFRYSFIERNSRAPILERYVFEFFITREHRSRSRVHTYTMVLPTSFKIRVLFLYVVEYMIIGEFGGKAVGGHKRTKMSPIIHQRAIE